MKLHPSLLGLILASTMAGAWAEGERVGDVIINTSLNGFIRGVGDVIIGGTIVQPRPGDDVELLITAISRDVDPRFDPVLVVRDLEGRLLATNDNWEDPEGDQRGLIHELIECYVAENIINPGDDDAVVLISLDSFSGDRPTVLAEVSSADIDSGRVVLSFTQVDGALFEDHRCEEL